MNSIDEILIKYGFIKKSTQNHELDPLISNLDININEYVCKLKKKRRRNIDKELKLINEIIGLIEDPIMDRIDFDLKDSLDKAYVVGECFDDINEIKKELNKNIKKQVNKEKSLIESIKDEIGNEEFIKLEHNLSSDEFLKYVTK